MSLISSGATFDWVRKLTRKNPYSSEVLVVFVISLLRERGVSLTAAMNTDKVNIVYYEQLSKRLLEEEGIYLSMAKLNDYGHFFGEAPFCAPDFDLFTHEEFFKAQFLEFAKRDHHAAELRDMLRPVRRFCSGQHDTYFIIDVRGDVLGFGLGAQTRFDGALTRNTSDYERYIRHSGQFEYITEDARPVSDPES